MLKSHIPLRTGVSLVLLSSLCALCVMEVPSDVEWWLQPVELVELCERWRRRAVMLKIGGRIIIMQGHCPVTSGKAVHLTNLLWTAQSRSTSSLAVVVVVLGFTMLLVLLILLPYTCLRRKPRSR
ncbi:uncharacterized protein K489DRAFT_382696 [Dissoconium aciculare CBS 342.82]|uniref:Uncharacterized protein n=1 Tax=Dissoconium aciculare CBS 342.82 TaxID=1314786 RepID=A0A6J3LZS0_9PEZI|nr:uncharacterized protein K489DRAFT_382696 [Dissoconium aciculare CBS 342.82]KAF1820754.1 hypothetical protein K489DRAFT_382696 [Dissoconium aciculare CBS 342.82]